MESLRERLAPWIGAGVAVLMWRLAGCPFPDNPDSLFGAAATVASVFASFLGVSKAILLTIKNTRTFQKLEILGFADRLFGFLKAGIFTAVVFASLSLLGLFVTRDKSVLGIDIYTSFQGVWFFCGAAALLTYLRITNILFKLLKQKEVRPSA